jgi:hypothetical protein
MNLPKAIIVVNKVMIKNTEVKIDYNKILSHKNVKA